MRSATIAGENPTAPWRSELAELLKIGGPMALTQLVQFSVNAVDIVMIGRLGPEPLAAAALGVALYYVAWLLGLGFSLAVPPLVSQALGADPDNVDDVRRSVRMGFWAVAAFFPAALLLFLFAGDIIAAVGQPEALARRAAPYVLALAPGLPFALFVITLRSFLAAIGEARAPLYVMIFTTLLNAFLNYLLIYGNWGFPRLELLGAGLASSIAHAAGFFLLVVCIMRDPRAARFRIFEDFLKPDWRRFREVFALGWPIGAAIAFEAMLFNAATFLMGRIGMIEVAAYQVAINIASLAFMMPLGLSMAGGVRVGLAAGAGDLARVRLACLLTVAVSVAAMIVFWAPVMIAPGAVIALYLGSAPGDAEAVRAMALGFLPIAIAFALFDATQVAANQCLRGLKDTTWPMWLTGVAYWAIGFPIAALLGLTTGLKSMGVWWGLLASLAAAAAFLSIRLWLLTKPSAAAALTNRQA